MGLVCLMMNGPFTSHRFMFAAAPKPCLARHPVLPVRVSLSVSVSSTWLANRAYVALRRRRRSPAAAAGPRGMGMSVAQGIDRDRTGRETG